MAGTNIENLGTEIERQCKESAAACEVEWHKTGKEPGLIIWRIEKFHVVPWPKKAYGQFYDGDSYIVLNTVGSFPNFKYDIHYWQGKKSSQDEKCVSAYKAVELDTYHKDRPVQHRETQGHESPLFLSYFEENGGLRLLRGGVESGTHHVERGVYPLRLMHFKGKKRIRITEVDLSYQSLNSGDVFVLDNGLTIYVWSGKSAGREEYQKAMRMANALDSERGSKPVVYTLTEDGNDPEADEFWKLMGGKGPIAPAVDHSDEEAQQEAIKKLFRLSDASGKLTFTKVAEGRFTKNELDRKDVFILDVGIQIYVWIGSGASANEKRNAMKYAEEYLKHENRPDWVSVTRVYQEGENPLFESHFSLTV